MLIGILRFIAIMCIAAVFGKLISKIKLPAILGWLITGIVFGPYLAEIVTFEIVNSNWYKIAIKFFECLAGVMIGRELIFKKIASSGKQIIGITFIQSISTFIIVTIGFAITFAIADLPIYLSFIFGGIALATAPAPALSIINEYKTDGPVTRTLIPLAAIDDIIGMVVFFSVISIIGSTLGGAATNAITVIGIIFLPFVIGITLGIITAAVIRKIKNQTACFCLLISGLFLSIVCGLIVDYFIFNSFTLNYLLIGMSFSAALANLIPEDTLKTIMEQYKNILNVALIIVIVNLGIPLDYRLIAGAGVFTLVYIVSRAVGKIGGAAAGGKIVKAEPTVTKYLGLTLLPHSGVSLIFTGIAVNTMTTIDASLAAVISGTIVSAAIINEIIAVILAKIAFKCAGEIKSVSYTNNGSN